MDEQRIRQMAARMRRRILDVAFACNQSAHLGGGLSMVEIMATLYGAVLHFDVRDPSAEDRDRFILSKGHGVLGLFSALNAVGFISDEVFATFETNESDLIAHPVMNLPLGIESSNGSLGHGLSMGVGLALAARKKGRAHRVFVLLGDGECNEGTVWEAAMSGAHFKLDNLVAIVDNNRLQSDGRNDVVMDTGDLAERWAGFGWNVCDVDGHSIPALYDAFTSRHVPGKPKAVVARTVKGKGVSFMENNNDWHHNRLTKVHYEQALQELGEV
jgi:transketolase